MISSALNTLWAKKAIEDGRAKWLPLPQHLMDTKFVASQLYRHYLSDNQRKIIRGAIQGDDTASEHLVQFLASAHDIGKATPAFQSKPGHQDSSHLDHEIRLALIQQKYFTEDSDELPYPQFSPHALAGEAILRHLGFHDDIGAIEGGHHGVPVDDILTVQDQYRKYLKNYGLDEQDEGVTQRWERTQHGLVEWCLHISGYPDQDCIPKIRTISAQVILEGMVIMADWIASNTRFFPLFDWGKTQPSNLVERLHSGWRAWFRDYQWNPNPSRDVGKYYRQRFGFKPRPLQKELFQTMERVTDPGIVIIESGMGSGKTEASLATVEQLAQKCGAQGMFYCLPTQGSTNAMFSRIKAWLDDIAQQNVKSYDIQLLHGKAAMNDEYNTLPRAQNIGEDSQATTLVNEWFSGNKTGLLGDFVVGTIDQLLKLGLKQPHLALRHLGFSQKAVVIDEAHSFDDYMQEYLYRALEWLGEYHIPVIVLSATLPLAKRDGMLRSYLGKPDYRTPERFREAYPLITYSERGQVKHLDDFRPAPPQSIQVHRLATTDLIPKLRSLLAFGGVAGVIVNTVKRAQRLAEMLMEEYPPDEITILHSSFIATHRMDKETELLDQIGKGGERYRDQDKPHRQIIIGTQVLEQSLDIDFDVMFSDLAPVDSLVQRLGRLQRHRSNDRARPQNLKRPQLYLLRTSDTFDFDRADKFIYSDYLLMRTQSYLPDTITLPQDIAPLVQKVYDPRQLQLSKYDEGDLRLEGPLQKTYRRARRQYIKQGNHKRQGAHEYMLDPYDQQGDDLIGWLRANVEDDAQGLAQVRDSSASFEVIVVQRSPDGQGYGRFGTREDISSQIHKTSIAKRLAKETLKLPNQLFQDPSHDRDEHQTMEDTIKRLRAKDQEELPGWQEQPFLRGQLGIILDTHQQCHLNGYLLTYSKKLGLRYERSDEE